MTLEQFLSSLEAYLQESLKSSAAAALKLGNTLENYVAFTSAYQTYEEVFYQVQAILRRKEDDDTDD